MKDIENYNIAYKFFKTTEAFSNKEALFYTNKRSITEVLTFGKLAKIANAYICEFRKSGIKRGDKVLFMLRYSPEFICSVFAIFAIGAVPVLIDPGMGLQRLLHCISHTSPEAMIGIPIVHWIRFFKKSYFNSLNLSFSTRGFFPPFLNIISIPSSNEIIKNQKSFDSEIELMDKTDLAAIVFTTGSTGPAKGVEYTHEIFNTQLKMIKKYYDAGPNHKDMPCFPLFAMFSICLGMPCVIPDINPSRPAKANPEKIAKTIIKHQITFSFASPTLWQNLANYCIKNKIKLTSLKKILMAGAPVPAELHKKLKEICSDDAETLVPYGATEALPIANFTGSEMLNETADLTKKAKGYCVGYPFEECEIRVIKASNNKFNDISETENLRTYEIGEIIVKGPVVTKAYHKLQDETEFAKIADKKNNQLWHRMGDMGYFDEKGRLWFCGRKNHIINTKNGIIYPAAMEAPFNIILEKRTALVGYTKDDKYEIPILVIEGKCNNRELKEIKETALKIAEEFKLDLRISQIKNMKTFPVDIRHNAKISREKIKEYIAKLI